MYPVIEKVPSLEYIEKYIPELLTISNLTESDIQNMWISARETRLTKFDALVYKYDMPLFGKMIFRWRNCQKSPAYFYNQIDPANKQRFLSYHLVYDRDFEYLMDFFVWLKNHMIIYEVPKEYLESWKKNEIAYFLKLPDDLKETLIENYQKFLIHMKNAYE